MEATNEQSITRFLLGELPEDERQNIEERFFADNSFYEQVLAVQEELADDYVRANCRRDKKHISRITFCNLPAAGNESSLLQHFPERWRDLSFVPRRQTRPRQRRGGNLYWHSLDLERRWRHRWRAC